MPLVSQSVLLTRIQARPSAMPEGESLAAFAATPATLVQHMAITRSRELASELMNQYGDCPVMVVHRTTQHEELVLRGTLTDIADHVEAADLRQAAVVLVGRLLARRRQRG